MHLLIDLDEVSPLFFRSVNPSLLSLSSYGRFCDFFVRVALRWTLSNVFESYSKWGYQIEEANSKWGLIKVEQTILAISSVHELNVFLIKPRTLLHSVTPSFFFSDEIILRTGLFTQLHDFAFFRSKFHRPSLVPFNYLVDVSFHIVIVDGWWNNFPSSAKSLNLCARLSGKSFIYIIISRGLRTDPCQIPLSTSHKLEPCSSKNTRSFLHIKKALTQATNFSSKP